MSSPQRRFCSSIFLLCAGKWIRAHVTVTSTRHRYVSGSLEAPSCFMDVLMQWVMSSVLCKEGRNSGFPGTYYYVTCGHLFVNKKTCYVWTTRHGIETFVFEREDMTFKQFFTCHFLFSWNPSFSCHFLFSWNPSFSCLQIPSLVCEALRYQCVRPPVTNLCYNLYMGVVWCPNIHALLISCLVTARICTL